MERDDERERRGAVPRFGDIERVATPSLLARMRPRGLEPTVVTYNSLMDAYARATHVDDGASYAAQVLRASFARAVAPTLLLISVVTAIAELVDFGDDNLNVPLCAAALSILLL